MRQLPIHVLTASLLLAGCSTPAGQSSVNVSLAGAHAALERDGLTDADKRLSGAEPSLHSDHERKTYELLRAETEIRTAQAKRALSRTDRLLAAYPHDPRAHELAGKAQLRLGDFTDASRHFDVARQRYVTRDDRSRATDLLALSNGLNAYTHGRLALAQATWARIKDSDVRGSVMNAYNLVAPHDASHRATVLGDSNKPL